MKTVLETLQSGTPWLEKAGIENARLNMEHLLASVLGCRRMQLYLDFDRPLTEDHLAPLRELVKRRARREPLQHLLGTVDFAGREFLCDARALVPRPETEELVARILTECKVSGLTPARVLDMGTGSGVVGLTLAHAWPEAQVTLADMSPSALELARENAGRFGLTVPRVQFILTDLWAGLDQGPFDLIAANLPYIPAAELASLAPEVQRDPALALDGGPLGTELIARFIEGLKPHAAQGALIALEIGVGQSPALIECLQQRGLNSIRCLPDDSRRERFLFARN